MRKILGFSAFLLFAWGLYSSYGAYRFVAESVRVTGKVIAVETLSGPPKPRQKIPVYVEFALNGGTIRTETRMPMLGSLRVGDDVPLWVSKEDPQDARLAEPSSPFAAPLTYTVCGLVALLLCVFYSSKSPPTSPRSLSPASESSST